MANDGRSPAWPGQQPTSFDPYTGQPLYAPGPAPGQSPQPQGYGQASPQQGGYPPQQAYSQQPQQQQQHAGYPPQAQQPGYPQQPQPGGYPQQAQQAQPGYPQQAQPGYPQQGQPSGYPQSAPQPGYPQHAQQPGYPQQAQQPGYPQQHAYAQPQPQPGYPQQAQAYGQQQPGYPAQAAQGYGQQQPGYPQQHQGYPPAPAPERDDDDDDDQDGAHSHGASTGDGLRAHANATLGSSDRVRFIRLTYIHLLGAMLAFAGSLWCLFKIPFLVEKVSAPLIVFALGVRWHWGVVLGAFMVVSWLADYWAKHTSSRAMQYIGLGLYVVAEALIFVPLLFIVQVTTAEIIARGGGNPNIIRDSAFTTIAIFTALTASVVFSKKDFSFMRSGLAMAGAAAMMLVVLSIVFGFNLGIVFSIAMVLLAAGYILYQTSQVLAHYHTEQYVAAALALFSSVALMFWYVIRIFMRARD